MADILSFLSPKPAEAGVLYRLTPQRVQRARKAVEPLIEDLRLFFRVRGEPISKQEKMSATKNISALLTNYLQGVPESEAAAIKELAFMSPAEYTVRWPEQVARRGGKVPTAFVDPIKTPGRITFLPSGLMHEFPDLPFEKLPAAGRLRMSDLIARIFADPTTDPKGYFNALRPARTLVPGRVTLHELGHLATPAGVPRSGDIVKLRTGPATAETIADLYSLSRAGLSTKKDLELLRAPAIRNMLRRLELHTDEEVMKLLAPPASTEPNKLELLKRRR